MNYLYTTYRKLINFVYIYKWFFVKKWYTSNIYFDLKEYKQTGKKKWREDLRVSKLTLGQIEGILYLIFKFYNKKWYRIGDYLRNKLCSVGYTWKEPKKWMTSNLLGHISNGLEFKKDKNEISLIGIVESKKYPIGVEIHYKFDNTSTK